MIGLLRIWSETRAWLGGDTTGAYIVQRLGLAVGQVAILLVLLFVLVVLLPGDTADVLGNEMLGSEQMQAQRQAMGLDRDPWLRFAEWLGGLLRGDLGNSLAGDRPVGQIIAGPFTVTALLAACAVLVLAPLTWAAGFASGLRPGSALDRVITTISITLDSVPDFVLALGLVAWLSLAWGLFPATLMGIDVNTMLRRPGFMVLPLTVMVARVSAPLIRQVRAGVINAMAEPYVVQAQRLGVPRHRLLARYVAPNALAPAMQELGRTSDGLLSGVLIVEAIFVVPGVASTLINAISTRDEPVVLGVMLVTGSLAILINVAIDVVGRAMVPRSVRAG